MWQHLVGAMIKVEQHACRSNILALKGISDCLAQDLSLAHV